MKRDRPGDWYIPGTLWWEMRKVIIQPFSSAVVMKTAVLWVCWRSTAVHSVIPAEKRHKYPLREPVRSTYYLLFTRTLHAACTQQKKTRNNMAENGGFYGRETNMKPNSKWSWPELRKKKRAWRLNWRYFEGASRPLIPVLHSPFYSLFVSRFVSMAKKKAQNIIVEYTVKQNIFSPLEKSTTV